MATGNRGIMLIEGFRFQAQAPRPGNKDRAMPRSAEVSRKTKETDISVSVHVDGTGKSDISTGVGFFDHMLDQLSRHSLIDMTVRAKGDLHIDDHHTVEDTGIAIGQALSKALGERRGIMRYASIDLAMDETMTKAAVDLSGRPFLVYAVDPISEWIGTFDPQLAEEFWKGFVDGAHVTMHLRSISGKNGHHVIEASFKGVARALRDAVKVEGDSVPSTKGTLSS